MSEPLLPFVSVIVPVYNDGERLRLCLQALEKQTYALDHYEVIVVDNAFDATVNIKSVISEFAVAIALDEETPGSYAARNKGLTVAKGEAIAFTDADCIPAPDWIEKGVAHLQRVNNCGLVGGKIELLWRNEDRPSAVELYESILAFPQPEHIEQKHFSATANLFTWKNVIKQVGVFNSCLKSGGDIEWGQRVHALGYQQVYAEDVKVAHPALYSVAQLCQKAIRHAGGTYDSLHQPKFSKFKSNQQWLKTIAFNLMPPVFFALNSYTYPQLKSLGDRLKVTFILTLVRYITVLELLRLKLGGVSNRQ